MSSTPPSLASIMQLLDDGPPDFSSLPADWQDNLGLVSSPPVPAPRPRPLVITWNAEQRAGKAAFADPYEGLTIIASAKQVSVQTVLKRNPTRQGVLNSQLGRGLKSLGAKDCIDLYVYAQSLATGAL